MIRRLRNSWAYRSSGLYRRLYRWRRKAVPAKPSSDLLYLTLGAAFHLEMMDASLRSLALSWSTLPRVRVVLADGTDPDSVRRRLSWWPGELEAIPWRGPSEWAGEAVSASIQRFAEREPMGRKMAAVFQAATEGAVLYSDVDVLWFAESPTVEKLRKEPGPLLAMSLDMHAAYDDRLVPAKLPELVAPPHYCAGLMFAKGAIHEAAARPDLWDFAADSGIGLTEQTIFAAMTRKLGNRSFGANEVFLSESDRFSSKPSFVGKAWTARHYVGQVRHLYWRDALAHGGSIAESSGS